MIQLYFINVQNPKKVFIKIQTSPQTQNDAFKNIKGTAENIQLPFYISVDVVVPVYELQTARCPFSYQTPLFPWQRRSAFLR